MGSFQYWQQAQNQPKSQILFHNNGSPRNLDIMTLYIHSTYCTEGSHNSHKIIFLGPITWICYLSSRKLIMKLFILELISVTPQCSFILLYPLRTLHCMPCLFPKGGYLCKLKQTLFSSSQLLSNVFVLMKEVCSEAEWW